MIPMKMPFGKYKGEPVEDLPIDYIEWCLENVNLRPELQKEMEAQVGAKRGEGIDRNKR